MKKKQQKKLEEKLCRYVRKYGSIKLEVKNRSEYAMRKEYGIRLLKSDGDCKIRYYHYMKEGYCRKYCKSCFLEDYMDSMKIISPNAKKKKSLPITVRAMLKHDRNNLLYVSCIYYGPKYSKKLVL